ncbi:MAG: accessory Sec system translocase SecA2 [Proteobacteria bacterium]|nr:accessory Sec system translocase SecA2 [Pseudomonadota bacterium]
MVPTNRNSRFLRWLDGIRGRPIEWDLSQYKDILSDINREAEAFRLKDADDTHLKQHSHRLTDSANKGASLDDLCAEAFALAREVSFRTVKMRHFDVQMIAGIALHNGRLVEMQTGEGKTLAAVLPTYLNALCRRGVHILTFNDYLAKRDAAWMKPIYDFLGLSVGFVIQGMTPEERYRAYHCDITYLTAREAGYDFLRQSLARDPHERVMRPFNFAIVDEADSILIDEARVPLVIAGRDGDEFDHNRLKMTEMVRNLKEGDHFLTDENRRNVFLTEKGQRHVQELLDCGNLYETRNRDFLTEVHQALHAAVLLTKNRDYIVRKGKVEIVDEFTGRVVTDRHWPDGLHRAVEAKEHLSIEEQGRILNSISMQHLINLYPKLSGMTGTVIPSEEEFEKFYRLKTVIIPPNKPSIRIDCSDVLFRTKDAKNAAIVDEIKRVHKTGRPILVGTSSVEESDNLALMLRDAGVECSVLNAKNDEAEAGIIREAGALYAVTVSTNMAGRGTDIRLGGPDEGDHEKVTARGGLYVIGTNRHESRRIDNQLRGRAGRQGEPGSSRYFVSIEDDLMKRFGQDRWIPVRLGGSTNADSINDVLIHKKIEHVQRVVEGQDFDIRNTLWSYSSFIEKQREKMQTKREEILLGNSPKTLLRLCPDKYRRLENRIERQILDEVEVTISLFHIDRCWSDHLARIADIREGIYLSRLGGRDPLHEFLKIASILYDQMLVEIDDGISNTFESARITDDGVDVDEEGIKGPSSTWTYLVNDNPFQWTISLTAPGNIGLSVGAGLWGGLFIIRSLYRRFINSKRS